MIQSKYDKRVFFITISPCIYCWILSSTTQSSSRQLNITLGWQKIEEVVRLVLDNSQEKNNLLPSSCRRSASDTMLHARRASSHDMLRNLGHFLQGISTPTRYRPQAFHRQRASHQTVYILFLADDRCLHDCRWAGPILSVFPALIVHSELKSVHPGFPVAFIF